jgi:hypothetical protein
MIPYRKFSDIQSPEFGPPEAFHAPKAPKVCDEDANDARTLDGLAALASPCPEFADQSVRDSVVANDRATKNSMVREYDAKPAKPAKDGQQCASGDRADWGPEDWRAHFDERAGFLEHDGGLLRVEAEVQTFEQCIVEWLNRNPSSSPAGRCAWCGKAETPSARVLPFGAGEHHEWLHAECWAFWYQRRREEAVLALRGMGIAPSGSLGRSP